MTTASSPHEAYSVTSPRERVSAVTSLVNSGSVNQPRNCLPLLLTAIEPSAAAVASINSESNDGSSSAIEPSMSPNILSLSVEEVNL